ncbi:MAG: ATP-binding cassette domain-containing protein [Nakamurella sp.]
MTSDDVTDDSGVDDLLTCNALSKSFGSTEVLRAVSLRLRAGETVAILGENGAGKSTLMKILAGIYPVGTYRGSITVSGKQVRFGSVHNAEAAGIVMVPQELHVVPHLSIAENMFAANLPGRRGIYSPGPCPVWWTPRGDRSSRTQGD